MKGQQITAETLIRNPDHRHFLAQLFTYAFVLYCAIPLLTGLIFPHSFGLTVEPSDKFLERITALLATGTICALVMVAPGLLTVRHRWLRAIHVYLLLPVSMVCLITQAIMYREFGTEIDTRIFGLVQGNFGALWTYAKGEYHIHWLILLMLAISGGFTWWLCRSEGKGWAPGTRVVGGVTIAAAMAGAVAMGLNISPKRAKHYHPTKIANSPLYQVVQFFGIHFLVGHASGYGGIMAKAEAFEGEDVYGELTRRLGAEPEAFALREVSRPSWMKREPSHVFLFIMESIEQPLLEDPNLKSLAPYINRYSEEGISVPNFSASSFLTIDSVHSMFGGVSRLDHYPVARALKSFPLDTLPDLMKQSGYKPVFYAASRREFGDKGDISEAYGYDFFKGCPDVEPGIRSNEWGVNDGDFFKWVDGELANMDQPHFVTLLNVSNHSPHDAPLEEMEEVAITEAMLARVYGRSREDKIKYAKHMAYADWQMGLMADRLKEKHPDALFIFVGDHCSTKLDSDPYWRVPFVLWNDRIVDTSVDTSNWFGTHMDFPATLAQLFLPEGETLSTLGQPVWSRNVDRICPCGPLTLTRKGYLSEQGDWLKLLPLEEGQTDKGFTDQDVVLRRSALDALSWGYINAEPLPPKQ